MDYSSAIMGTIGGAAQSIIGVYQTAKGLSDMKKLGPRPEYEIPGPVDAYMNTAEQMAYEGLPKAQKMAFLREQQRNEAAMLYASGSLDAQLSGAAAAKIASSDAIGDLYTSDAAARLQGKQSFMQALLVGADYENEKYRQDLTTYLDKRDTAMSMIGAGTQNIVGGFDTAGSAWTGGEGTQFKAAETGSQQTKKQALQQKSEMTDPDLPDYQSYGSMNGGWYGGGQLAVDQNGNIIIDSYQ